MKYYVRIGTEAPKVLTEEEIFPLIKAGTITPETKGCAVGATAWTSMGQLLPKLFLPDAEPPSEGGAMEFVGKAGHFIAEHGGEVASLAKVFTRRIFASNFAAEAALPEERAVLERSEPPIRSPMAQNYVAWRRAILWVAGIGLTIAAIITFINDFKETFRPNLPTALRFVLIGIQVLNVLAPLLVIRAALRWTQVRRSRRMAKFGWLCQFLGPMLLMLIPVKEFTTNQELAAYTSELKWSVQYETTKKEIEKMTDAAQKKEAEKNLADSEKTFRDTKQKAEIDEFKALFDDGQKKWKGIQKEKKTFTERMEALGAMGQNRDVSAPSYLGITALVAANMALIALVTLLPRIFGMFPGIVRASLTLRTLVPESPLPGYVATIIEPLYVLLVLVFVALSSQLSEWLVFNGLVCLLGSAYFLLTNARALCKPVDSASMTAHLKPLRKKMLLCTVAGLIFLISGLAEYITQIGFWSITGTVCHLIANIVLLTAVAADFMLGLMKFSFDQDQAMKGTALQTDLENRFADLAQARLANIVDEPPPVVETPPNAAG